MKKLLIVLIALLIFSCNKNENINSYTPIENIITYHVFDSTGDEHIYVKKFNKIITHNDSVIFKKSCVTDSLIVRRIL